MEAQRLAEEVENSGPALFHLTTTIADLQTSYDLQSPGERAELSRVLEFVRAMLPAGHDHAR